MVWINLGFGFAWLMAAALRGTEVFLHRTDVGSLYRIFLPRQTAAQVGPQGKGRLAHKSLGEFASPLKSTCRDAVNAEKKLPRCLIRSLGGRRTIEELYFFIVCSIYSYIVRVSIQNGRIMSGLGS